MKEIKEIEIKSIKKVDQIKNHGILYSEYAKLEIIFENDFSCNFCISNWYTQQSQQLEEFKKELSKIAPILYEQGYYVIINQNVIDKLFDAI
jgi:protein-disulfide isomerase